VGPNDSIVWAWDSSVGMVSNNERTGDLNPAPGDMFLSRQTRRHPNSLRRIRSLGRDFTSGQSRWQGIFPNYGHESVLL